MSKWSTNHGHRCSVTEDDNGIYSFPEGDDATRKEQGGRRGGTKPQAAFCVAPESPPGKWLDSEGGIWERVGKSQSAAAQLVCTHNCPQNDSTDAIISAPSISAPEFQFLLKSFNFVDVTPVQITQGGRCEARRFGTFAVFPRVGCG